MGGRSAGLIVGMLFAASSAAVAHHSMAMFDRDHPVELYGMVRISDSSVRTPSSS